MTFTPLETVNLGDRVIDAIRTAIITGTLAPGEAMRDVQLAEELGVSRTPVREALQRLQSAGLVEFNGKSGWVVAQFTERDVRELFQLRMLLEPTGLDKLEQDPDPAQVTELARFFATYEHPIASERHLEYFGHDDDFHKLLVACSGSKRIQGIYDVLNGHINRGRYLLAGSSVERMEETLDEHKAIVDAISNGDFARARSALLQHLKTGEELMLLRLEDQTKKA